MPRPVSILAAWLAVWLFWIWLARHHHPTLPINMLASGVLVSACALVVHVGAPKADGQFSNSLHLILRFLALGTVAALLIGWLYDQLWGPDPLRYSFAVNLAMDTTFIAVHYALAKMGGTIVRIAQGCFV